MNTIPHGPLETFVANGQAAQAAVDKVLVQFNARKDGGHRIRSTVDPCPFLDQDKVRKFLLETAAKERPFHKWTRVSGETMLRLNEIVRTAAIGHVKRLPSKGKTI